MDLVNEDALLAIVREMDLADLRALSLSSNWFQNYLNSDRVLSAIAHHKGYPVPDSLIKLYFIEYDEEGNRNTTATLDQLAELAIDFSDHISLAQYMARGAKLPSWILETTLKYKNINPHLIKILLDYGLKLGEYDSIPDRVLCNKEILAELLKTHKFRDYRLSEGLEFTIMHGCEEAAILLIQYGAVLKNTYFFWEVQSMSKELAALLLAGGTPNIAESLQHLAIRTQNVEIFKLASQGLNISNTIVERAVEQSREIFAYIEQVKPDIISNPNIIGSVIRKKICSVAKELIEKGYAIGDKILNVASENCDLETVQYLIARGATPDHHTVLSAIFGEKIATIKYLLDSGVDVGNWELLLSNEKLRNEELILLFVRYKILKRKIIEAGILAAEEGRIKFLHQLVAGGISFTCRILYAAAEKGQLQTLQYLSTLDIKYGADEFCSLLSAGITGGLPILKFLLSHRLIRSYRLIDLWGIEKKGPEYVSLLEQYGIKIPDRKN